MPHSLYTNILVVSCLLAVVLLTAPVMGEPESDPAITPVELNEEENTSAPDTNSSSLPTPSPSVNESEPDVVPLEGSDNVSESNSGPSSPSSKGKKGNAPDSEREEETDEESVEESDVLAEEEIVLHVPEKENAILPVPSEVNVVSGGAKLREFLTNGVNGENATLLITGGLFIVVFVLGASVFNTMIESNYDEPATALELSSVLISPLSVQAGRVKSSFDAGLTKAREMKLKTLDDIFDSVVALGIGDPRVTSSSKKNKMIRIYNCIECEKVRTRKEGVCEFTKGFLTGGFRNIQKGSIDVVETKCCGSGADYCEYSIVFGR